MSRLLVRPPDMVAAGPGVSPAAVAVGVRPARGLHPWAWWCWALSAGIAVSLTVNVAMILLIVVAVVLVMEVRRSDAPWARSVGLYFGLAGVIVVIRVVFQILFGSLRTGIVLVRLPSVPLPGWMQGISIGGPVTLDALSFAVSDALRIGALIVCVGMANALANPKRALRAVPAALYEVSTALVIALSVAPQLIESALRVRRARRLRGGRTKGWQAVIGVIVPVLDDAIERSMSLAAGMESRGYGSTRRHLRHPHRVTALMIAALVLLGFGAFLLLGLPRAKAGVAPFVCLAAGVVAAVAALRSAGTARSVTRYRPDPWGAPEWAVVLFGLAGLGAMVWLSATAPGVVSPPVVPAAPPVLHPAMLLVAAAFVGPLAVTSTPAPHGGRS